MQTMSFNDFHDNLQQIVSQSIDTHTPVTVTRQDADSFVVMGIDEWQAIEETLYVLQNQSLMNQIQASSQTHQQQTRQYFCHWRTL